MTEPKDGWLNAHWSVDELSSPEQTRGFEPDWTALYDILYRSGADTIFEMPLKEIIDEYQRQHAAAGLVDVRAEDAKILLDAIHELHQEGISVDGGRGAQKRVRAILAASKEQP